MLRSFIHNCIAHPLLWFAELFTVATDALHDATAPKERDGLALVIPHDLDARQSPTSR